MTADDKVNAYSRLMMICIDAASLEFITAHRDALPVFSSLIQEGAVRPLRSTADVASASVWQTFVTGTGPGAHGHYYPLQWNGARMAFDRPVDGAFGDSLVLEPFWRDIARSGVPTIAFDIGLALHCENAPCTEIANWSAQSSGDARASDPALLAELRRRFGARPIGKEVPVKKTTRHTAALRDRMIDAIARKTEAILWMSEREDWRLFVTGYYELHRAGHNLLDVDGDFGSDVDPEALLDVYRAQDAALGRLIERVRDARTTIAVFTLHGMGPNYAQDHFMPALTDRLNAAWRAGGNAAPPPAIRSPRRSNLFASARRLVPPQLQYALAHLLGESIQDFVVGRAITHGRNWRATPSFSLVSAGEGFIRLNIKGRERDGYFDAGGADLSAYRSWLIERLSEIRVSDTNEPFVRAIIDGPERFPGPRAHYLPDLVLQYAPSKPVRAISSPVIGEITAKLQTGRGGNHTGDAFLIATGAGARDRALASVGDIRDLARLASELLVPSPAHS